MYKRVVIHHIRQLLGDDFGSVVETYCMLPYKPVIGTKLLDHELLKHEHTAVPQMPLAPQTMQEIKSDAQRAETGLDLFFRSVNI